MRATVRLITLTLLMTLALPALAHGDHDARPLLRDAELGPYSVSLWQVYPDAGSVMTPLLIVMFDEGTPKPETAISVEIGAEAVDIVPSMTSPGAWETTTGVDADDLVTVTVSEDGESWSTPIIMIPPPLTSMFPMRALIAISIFLATAVAWWIGGRTAQAWRRPTTYGDVGLEG
ncbi:MAG TPA: hypothetical protein VHM29_04215 [Acidimicrobiia bacterium]|nr:hypothetical protein [Acidimicrobiia bacterium]